MASKIKVTGWTPIHTKWKKNIPKYAEKGMKDVMTDLGNVAQSMAPRDTGTLENSMKTNLKSESKTIVGEMTFVAYNPKDHFNYAVWTHEMAYNLGPGSLLKSPKPSRYGRYTGFVGTGYAIRPALALAPFYAKHIGEIITKRLN